jgi:murein DD-endopeptidase MepM/ murein hydrolase activator NlpD
MKIWDLILYLLRNSMAKTSFIIGMFVAALFTGSLLLTGCDADKTEPPVTVQPSATTVLLVTATPGNVDGVTPTAIVDIDPIGDRSPEGEIPPTAAPDPLRFVFPESGPPPVSSWRPPLYEVPWAPTPYDHFYFYRPIAADDKNWPDPDYRYGGVFFEDVVHTGVDIPAEPGTPVLAAAGGKVEWAGYGLYRGVQGDLSDPYGLAVVIRHDFSFQNEQLYSVYGHLQQIDVARGQRVSMGEQIGLVGQTGKVTGPHLHFEVRVGTDDYFSTLNPELWLVPPQGWGVAVARVMDTMGALYSDERLRFISMETNQVWRVRPYAGGEAHSDPYYRENMVISDLPAGMYEVRIDYGTETFNYFIQINPGRVTYFTFRGRSGFSSELPPNPGADFAPPDISVSP